jgi:hypothetical protein
MQRVTLVANMHRLAGIRTTVVSNDDIVPLGKNIGNLSFTLASELRPMTAVAGIREEGSLMD